MSGRLADEMNRCGCSEPSPVIQPAHLLTVVYQQSIKHVVFEGVKGSSASGGIKKGFSRKSGDGSLGRYLEVLLKRKRNWESTGLSSFCTGNRICKKDS